MSPTASFLFSFSRWIAMVCLPFITMSVYLWVSRTPTRWFTASSDYIAFGVSIAVFVMAALALPLGRKKKILIAACCAPFVAVALVFYALNFVGIVFGDWL